MMQAGAVGSLVGNGLRLQLPRLLARKVAWKEATMFLIAFVFGVLGLLAMALLGVAGGHHDGHGHNGHGHNGHGHNGHGHNGHAGHNGHGGHGSHNGNGHGHHAGHNGHTGHGQAAGGAGGGKWFSELLPLLSPRLLFSLSLVFGAIGLSFSGLPLLFSLPLAIAGALAFERFLIAPYWRLLTSFASRPAKTLDGAVLTRAKAVTDFHNGEGLIELELDGQVRQMLGTLTANERALAVQSGEIVRIVEVKPSGNCVVSKL
jgi:membrane protein implicated in regulation of membrane protease activity